MSRKLVLLRTLRNAFFFLVVFIAGLAPASQAAETLTFFKNYFVTGGHAVAGVGLRGKGVNGWVERTITMTSVPCTLGSAYVSCDTPDAVPADIVAAFLYWQTVETTTTPASRIGYFNGGKILGKLVGDPSACWSSGGTNPQTPGRVYRADVLRRLPIDSTNNVRLANGVHTVKLIDSGGGGNGNVPYTNGASLVVIYRVLVPGNPTFAPLRAVVLHDGGFTMPSDSQGLTLSAAGFFQAASAADAKMTQIVANGRSDFRETLKVNGTTLSEQPYKSTEGERWDNPTFPFNLAENASSYTTTVTPATNQTCVTFAAQVTELKVKDGDSDGLLDIWEEKGLHQNDEVSPATFGSCENYANDCVNLPAMGADKNVKDIFIELDWMHGDDGHEHVPKLAALYKVACAFANKDIAVHFDVKNLYPNESCLGSTKSFIVPAAHAKGGEVIEESSLSCPLIATSNNDCAYDVEYSVLSYKTGFRLVRDGFSILKNGVRVVDFPRRFARNRKDIFHYGLFAHALAGPFNPTTGQPLTTDAGSISGVGDRPGGDFMVTLGRWRFDDPVPCNPAFDCADQTGSADVQAGTLTHELGHNLFLSHAGNSRFPNCLPNYPSVMNYNYQVRLLTDLAGNSNVDFSDGALKPFSFNESTMSSQPGSMGPLKYRVRFYGPPINPHEGRAKAYCDGKTITGGPAVRLEAPTVGTPDWDRDGDVTDVLSFDVNYSGTLDGTTFNDSNDWASLNLQQVSARLNSNGVSTDVGALDLGALDLGALDLGTLNLYLGALDLGALDLGALDLGALDLGALDLGALDLGALDLGALDLGALDLGALDLGESAGDVSFEDINGSPDATSSSQPLTATSGINAITLSWGAPPIVRVRRYDIHRSDDGIHFILLGSTGGIPPLPGYVDQVNDFVNSGTECPNIPTKTCYNKNYTYYITTWVLSDTEGLVESGASNMANGQVKRLFVIAGNQSIVYGDPLPAPSFAVYGNEQGTLPLAGVSCVYTPSVPRDIGNYPITCSGPGTTTPANGVSYDAVYNDGVVHTPGNLSITRRPVTASITANDKYYDGTNIATLAGCTLTGVVNGDAVTCGGTATFASIHAGNWLVTANITLSGAAAGNYYLVSSAPTTRANINPRPITVTADAKNKFYGEADPPLTYQVTSGSLVAGDSFTGGLTRVPGENLGSYAILQGTLTAGSNYAVSYVGALLTIKVRPITFTVTGSMGAARSFHTATLILKDGPNKGKVLVSGGLDSKGAPLASAELYDPITRTFSVTGNNLPNKAAGHTATTLPNGNILVVGGGNSSSEIYDPTTNVWSSAGGISGPRTHHTAVLLNTGKVLITGGSDSSGKTIATSLLYDPAAGAYSNTGSLSVSREFHTATLLPNGKVLVAGGRSRNGNGYTHLSSAELYDPATGSFTAVASPMSSARHGHRAIESNGKILLVGGANSTTVAAADWYDPVSGTFTAAASLNTPRQNFTATVFAGAVVVAGGVNGSTRLLTAEQYVGTFLLAGDTMTTARAAHTATLLNGGSAVLITGGQGNGGTSVATAELLTVK